MFEVSAAEAQDPVDALQSAPIERVLILGDSHMMGFFGRVLHKEVRNRFGANVTTVGACGKSEPGFLKGSYTGCGVQVRTGKSRVRYVLGCPQRPCKEKHGKKCSKRMCRPKKLKSYLRQLKPDLVIVQLGANSMWMGSAEKGWPLVRSNIQKLSKTLDEANARCVWVTPPDTMIRKQTTQNKFTALYEEELAGKCAVFNSRPSHRPYLHYAKIVREMKLGKTQHDRMHYWVFGRRGRQVQAKWAREVIQFTSDHYGPERRTNDVNAVASTTLRTDSIVSPIPRETYVEGETTRYQRRRQEHVKAERPLNKLPLKRRVRDHKETLPRKRLETGNEVSGL